MHLRGIRALAAVSGVDMTIGVMCTNRGAQATEKAAQLGLISNMYISESPKTAAQFVVRTPL